MTIIHRGHVEINDSQLGATLTLEPGRVVLEVASVPDTPHLPDRIDLVRFTSNTGYFTIIELFRRNHNLRLGVGGLSTYTGGLAFESGYFSSPEEIRSRSWSMHVGDIAKIIHVNGVLQWITLPEAGGMITNWTIESPQAVVLDCTDTGISVRLGQHIQIGGNAIDGPTLTLSYPAEVIFSDEVGPEVALTMMHRVRQLFSLVMGRVLPITRASVRFEIDGESHDMPIHGLLTTETSEKPSERLLVNVDADLLARILDRWLVRYDELNDAIGLHMSGLEQRKLPTELRFQIFIQALEALHRKTASAIALPINSASVLEILRDKGISNDVVDRVGGVLAHAHEPGLRQRLRHYWDLMSAEIAVLRPTISRKSFIGRVAATRNHYAHRTDRDDQVLQGIDLWDATETVKAISHMALLQEVGADTKSMGQVMLDRRFAEYVLRN